MDNLLDSLVGRRIGNYIVSSLLQEGGMGAVYLAEHPEIGRRVAIKVLPRQQSELPGVAERFIVEARAIARVDHPNVIEIYDFGRTADGQLYYIMELLEGRELGELMSDRGPMLPEQIAPLLLQICAGLQAAHATGVIHRDLKPENIFLDERGASAAVKILDFGIAKLLEDRAGMGPAVTQTGMVIGTPYTIAPEQAAGRSDQIGPHTDIYSLGVILYWMLAGYPPFMAEPTAVILAQHIKESPPPLAEVDPTLPAPLVALVDRCLSKLPSERPASALAVSQIFAQAVEPAKAGGAVVSDGPSSPMLGVAGMTVQNATLPAPVASPEQDASGTVADLGLPAALRAAASRPSQPPPSGPPPSGNWADDRTATLHRPAWRWALIGSVGVALLLGTFLAVTGDEPGVPAPLDGVPSAGTPSASRDDAVLNATGRRAALPAQPIEADAGRAPDAASERRLAAAAPDAGRRSHEVEVTSEIEEASCRFSLDGLELPAIPVPCRIVVREGRRLRLSVLAEGYQRYERDWTVRRDETLSVALVPAAQDVDSAAPRGMTGADDEAPSARRTPDATPKRATTRPKRRRRSTGRTVKREQQQKTDRLGSGMMEF